MTKCGHITLNQHLTICRPQEQKWQKTMSFSAQTFKHLQSVTDLVLKSKLVGVKFYKTFVFDKLEYNISFTPPCICLHVDSTPILRGMYRKRSSSPQSSYIFARINIMRFYFYFRFVKVTLYFT